MQQPKLPKLLRDNLNNKRIRVSKKNNIKECLFATSGNIDKKIEFPTENTGSAALDMAYIACGRYDGYFQKNLTLTSGGFVCY